MSPWSTATLFTNANADTTREAIERVDGKNVASSVGFYARAQQNM